MSDIDYPHDADGLIDLGCGPDVPDTPDRTDAIAHVIADFRALADHWEAITTEASRSRFRGEHHISNQSRAVCLGQLREVIATAAKENHHA